MTSTKKPLFYNTFYVIEGGAVLSRLGLAVSYVLILSYAAFILFDWLGIKSVPFYIVLIPLFLRYGWIITKTVVTRWKLNKHRKSALGTGSTSINPQTTALYEQFNTRDGRKETELLLLRSEQDWAVYDLGLSTVRRDKYNARASVTTMYHTVFDGQLAREVPNIVFDSHSAYGRQFRTYFVGAQSILLDADMSDYYDAFVPHGYHVDALSIIGPEVLEVMKEFELPCDIEFTGNRVVCHAPLVSYDKLQTFQEQCLRLVSKCNDTLLSYRDDHVHGKGRIDSIHGFARSLLRSPFYRLSYLVSTTVLGIALCALMTASHSWAMLIQNPLMLVIFCVTLMREPYLALAQWRRNKIQKRSYESSLRFVAMRNKNIY